MRTRALASIALVLLLAPETLADGPSPGGTTTADVSYGRLFEDATARARLGGVNGAHVSFADLDGDGRPDAIVDSTRVFLNRDAHFVEPASPTAFVPAGARGFHFVQVADVNGDHHADLFLGRTTDLSNEKFKDDGLRNELWLGDGTGHFHRMDGSGLGLRAETSISACFFDYDKDGVLDVFVAQSYVAYGKSLEAFPSRLFRGLSDGHFDDVTERAGLLCTATAGLATSRRPTYGCTHADWNDDGWDDILTSSYGRQWNRLWRNNGDGTFSDVAPETTFDGDADRSGRYPDGIRDNPKDPHEDEKPFRSNGNGFDCAVADYDGDGYLDCFLANITHWWAGPSSDLSMILHNEGPGAKYAFQRHPELIVRKRAGANWNQGDMHAGWLDVDNDGLLDLVIASSDYPDEQLLRLYHQKPDHTFEEWTGRLGFKWINATQISLGDFDRDGATDIIVGTSNNRLTAEQAKGRSKNVGLFRNVCAAAAGNTFVSLRLHGKGGPGHANADAVGARVTLWIGGQRQTREVQGGLGHAGHRDDQECRFGCGKAARVDRIEVRWPDRTGTVQTFSGVTTGQFYDLVEGEALRAVAP